VHLCCSATVNPGQFVTPQAHYFPQTQRIDMFVTHYAHKHPPPGYRSTESNTSSDHDATPTPWPAPGIVHLFPDTPISDIPASYTAGKEWTYVAGEGWFERGTYRSAQSQPEVISKTFYTPMGRRISYYRLARSVFIFFIIGPLLVFLGLKASVGVLLYGWRRLVL